MTDDVSEHTVLVAYLSQHGSTAEIAEHVAQTLRDRGLHVRVASIADDPDPDLFEAVIVGSAVHNRDVLPGFWAFTLRHREALRSRPTWVFTVGVGPAMTGPLRKRLGGLAPYPMARIRSLITLVDYRAFAGVFARPANPIVRIAMRLLGYPSGDLRDWTEIGHWANHVADHIDAALAPTHLPEPRAAEEVAVIEPPRFPASAPEQ